MLLAMTITKQRIKFGFSRKVALGVTSHLDAGLGVFSFLLFRYFTIL